MATKNDVTNDLIYSAGNSDEWDDNYGRIFGYRPAKANPRDWEDGTEELDCMCCSRPFLGHYSYGYCKLCSD